jgi:hypothetical protein
MQTCNDEALVVERLTPDLEPALTEFLRGLEQATVFHEPWWFKVLEETYGHRCDFWIARDAEKIRGVFPVVMLRVPLLGTKAIATPYQYHCGAPLVDSQRAFDALLEQARRTATQAGAHYIEVRNFCEIPGLERLGYQAIDTQLCKTVVSLRGFDMKSLRKGHKLELKKVLASDLRVEQDGTLQGLRTFWKLYRIDGRELAGPQAGWQYFDSLYHNAGSRYRLWLAHKGSDCIGGLVTLDNGMTVFARNGAYSSPQARTERVTRALHWHSMVDAAARGCSSYDYGISWVLDKGLIDFKEGWKGITRPVSAYVLPLKSSAPSPGGYFEGYQFAKAIWRKLPIPIVDRLGHQITRWIG